MTFFDPPGSIEQTAYPLPHCQQGEVAGIIIFCLAYQFLPLSLTNPEKVVGLENVTDLKRVAYLKNISDLKKTVVTHMSNLLILIN